MANSKDNSDNRKPGPKPGVSDGELKEAIEELGSADVNELLAYFDWSDRSNVITRAKQLAERGEIVHYRPSREHNFVSKEKFSELVNDKKFELAIKQQDVEMATTDEVADEIGVETNISPVFERLRKLEDDGKVLSKGSGDVGDLVWRVK